MDIGGSNLFFRAGHWGVKSDAAVERLPGSPIADEIHDDSDRYRQPAAFRFATATALTVAFLGMLFAIVVMTDSPDGANLAGHPLPVPAPTAVLEQGDQDQSIVLAEGFDVIGVTGDAQERGRVDSPAASTIIEASASQPADDR